MTGQHEGDALRKRSALIRDSYKGILRNVVRSSVEDTLNRRRKQRRAAMNAPRIERTRERGIISGTWKRRSSG
jgi:hypothetical protein